MAACVGKYVPDIPATSSRTVTPYFIHGATTKCSWAFWWMKAVQPMYIQNNGHIALWLTMMQGQQSLMLRWCSHPSWDRVHVVFSFSYKGGQYFVYNCLQPVALPITQDTTPTIVDAPLMLILKMRQAACRFLFFLWGEPILCLWPSATCCPTDYPRYMTTNRWHSIDAHFQDKAGRASKSVLPIKAGRNSSMTVCNLSAVCIRRMQDQQFWRSSDPQFHVLYS